MYRKYAKGGVLPGKVDYEPQDGELVIPLKQIRSEDVPEVFRCYKEQYEKYQKGGICRNFWTPAHAETMMYFRLRLIGAKIAWIDVSDEFMIRTHFRLTKDDKVDWSVICGKHSMGGTDGLLEVWKLDGTDPSGGYTIDEVMQMIEKAREADGI